MEHIEKKLDQCLTQIHKLDKKLDAVLINHQYQVARTDRLEKGFIRALTATVLLAIGAAAYHGPTVIGLIKLVL